MEDRGRMRVTMAEISEIVSKQLKDFYNIALSYIEDGSYSGALECYEKAAALCEVLKYRNGIGMACISIANLYFLQKQYEEAFQAAEKALNYYTGEEKKQEVREFIKKLALYLVQGGMELEKEGNFRGAVCLFEQALPYLSVKRQHMVALEIRMLKDRDVTHQ